MSKQSKYVTEPMQDISVSSTNQFAAQRKKTHIYKDDSLQSYLHQGPKPSKLGQRHQSCTEQTHYKNKIAEKARSKQRNLLVAANQHAQTLRFKESKQSPVIDSRPTS